MVRLVNSNEVYERPCLWEVLWYEPYQKKEFSCHLPEREQRMNLP